MKFIHLSDLHIGKNVNGFSMLDEQSYIIEEILKIIESETPEAVILAGDIYDKSIPSEEAVHLFDNFLVRLSKLSVQVLIISGNHDSAERIAFGGRLMESQGIHFSPIFDGEVKPIVINDLWGEVNFYLFPFVKPYQVKALFPEKADEIQDWTDAMRVCIEAMHINCDKRNVLVAHQFVTGSTRSESEEISVGGADNVNAEVFAPFDYVALGHIHGPQNVGGGENKNRIRYCGTPLKYSFSEVKHKKSVTVIELEAKDESDGEMSYAPLKIREISLKPLHDWVEIQGKYDELVNRNYSEQMKFKKDDFVHVILTDEEDVFDAVSKLRSVYPNLMKLDYENARTKAGYSSIDKIESVEKLSPLELFKELYLSQNGKEMSAVQETFMKKMIKETWEEACDL